MQQGNKSIREDNALGSERPLLPRSKWERDPECGELFSEVAWPSNNRRLDRDFQRLLFPNP